jgi:DNA-binding transcriptional LysR family regulator
MMRFDQIDLTDLRLFLHIVDAASITRGAERVHLALPSASARVRNIERALGIALLDRQPRGVRPTAAGQALAHHARVVLQQMAQLHADLGEYAHGLKGHVRLLANTAAITEFLPEALAGYLAANPRIDIDLEERLSYEIVRAIAEGLADIGIVADTVDLGALETRPFRPDRLVLVVPRGHRLASRARVAFREVIDQPFVGLSADSALQDYLGEHAARAGRRLTLRVRLRSFEAMCRMVERGVGLAVMPETAVRRSRRAMAIRAIPLTDAWALRNLLLCVRNLEALPAHARRLVDHLAAQH